MHGTLGNTRGGFRDGRQQRDLGDAPAEMEGNITRSPVGASTIVGARCAAGDLLVHARAWAIGGLQRGEGAPGVLAGAPALSSVLARGLLSGSFVDFARRRMARGSRARLWGREALHRSVPGHRSQDSHAIVEENLDWGEGSSTARLIVPTTHWSAQWLCST